MMPMTVINIRPVRKFRLFKIRKSTSGCSTRNSQTMKPIKAATEITVNQRIQSAPNQSASCPLSKTICSVASQTTSRPNPMKSIAAFRLRLM